MDAPQFALTVENLEVASAVLGSVTGLLTAVTALFLSLKGRRAARQPQASLEERISQAHTQLQEGARLIEEISTEIETEKTTLEKLRLENEKNQRLAELNEAQAKAVSHLVQNTIAQGNKKLNRSATLQQSLFFLAGLLLSPLVQMFFTWIFSLAGS